MDNLTHSLIGAVLAECIYQRSPSIRRPTVAPTVRRIFWLVSILGNNLPDLDVLYAGLVLNGRLGYLLHHRGFTHTIVLVLLQGALLAGFAHWWLNRKAKKVARWDYFAVWGLALLGPLAHLAMDGFNNYGIHPLWPFWNGWVYGDTLFIMEPLLWVALFPVVYFATKRRSFRWIGETVMVALFTAMWILPITRWYSATAIVLFGCLLWFLTLRATPRWRADICALLALGVMGTFYFCSNYSRSIVASQNSALHPSAKLHDVVLTPYPSNPFCWNVVTVETFSEGSRYRLRRGRFSPFPSVVEAADCPDFPSQGSTAYLTPVGDGWGSRFVWEGQYLAAVSDLRNYVDYSCPWYGYLKFARAPFLQEEKESIWAGDLRYDYRPELDFAELEVPESPPPCSSWMPGWLPPRHDIF